MIIDQPQEEVVMTLKNGKVVEISKAEAVEYQEITRQLQVLRNHVDLVILYCLMIEIAIETQAIIQVVEKIVLKTHKVPTVIIQGQMVEEIIKRIKTELHLVDLQLKIVEGLMINLSLIM